MGACCHVFDRFMDMKFGKLFTASIIVHTHEIDFLVVKGSIQTAKVPCVAAPIADVFDVFICCAVA